MQFEGKVAIITGGASGIGFSCALGYAKKGAMGVVIADVQQELGEKAARKIKDETGCDVQFVRTDVSDEISVREMVDFSIKRWGKIDILINNASICPVVSWDDTTKESWDKVISINLTGMYLCTKEVGKYMKEKRSGKILFISSTAALDGSHIAHVAYGVTKAGALALMKSTAKEFATYNVSSVAILPGTIDTAINQSFTEQQREKMADSNLMKRRGGAEEVAAAVLFLTGPDATFITGASLQVSGGEILAQG